MSEKKVGPPKRNPSASVLPFTTSSPPPTATAQPASATSCLTVAIPSSGATADHTSPMSPTPNNTTQGLPCHGEPPHHGTQHPLQWRPTPAPNPGDLIWASLNRQRPRPCHSLMLSPFSSSWVATRSRGATPGWKRAANHRRGGSTLFPSVWVAIFCRKSSNAATSHPKWQSSSVRHHHDGDPPQAPSVFKQKYSFLLKLESINCLEFDEYCVDVEMGKILCSS